MRRDDRETIDDSAANKGINWDTLSPRSKVIIVSLIIIGIVTFALTRPDTGGEERDSSRRNYVTPEELTQEWQANNVAFEDKWFGKEVRMGGKILSVEERFSEGYRITMGRIDCNIGEDSRRVALNLRKGQEIVVIGTVESSFLGFDLFDCRVVRTYP